MQSTGYSCRILIKLEFSWQIFENFMEIRPVGAELFQVDGRTDRHTDMTKLIFAFHNLAKAPKNTWHGKV
jgi:hypothetical protein